MSVFEFNSIFLQFIKQVIKIEFDLLNSGINVVNGIPGAKLAMGLAKDVVAGESMSTIISNRFTCITSFNFNNNIIFTIKQLPFSSKIVAKKL